MANRSSKKWRVRAEVAERELRAAKAKVDEQAKDDGLWFCAAHAPEAYLQSALRELHSVIEGDSHGTP